MAVELNITFPVSSPLARDENGFLLPEPQLEAPRGAEESRQLGRKGQASSVVLSKLDVLFSRAAEKHRFQTLNEQRLTQQRLIRDVNLRLHEVNKTSPNSDEGFDLTMLLFGAMLVYDDLLLEIQNLSKAAGFYDDFTNHFDILNLIYAHVGYIRQGEVSVRDIPRLKDDPNYAGTLFKLLIDIINLGVNNKSSLPTSDTLRLDSKHQSKAINALSNVNVIFNGLTTILPENIETIRLNGFKGDARQRAFLSRIKVQNFCSDLMDFRVVMRNIMLDPTNPYHGDFIAILKPYLEDDKSNFNALIVIGLLTIEDIQFVYRTTDSLTEAGETGQFYRLLAQRIQEYEQTLNTSLVRSQDVAPFIVNEQANRQEKYQNIQLLSIPEIIDQVAFINAQPGRFKSVMVDLAKLDWIGLEQPADLKIEYLEGRFTAIIFYRKKDNLNDWIVIRVTYDKAKDSIGWNFLEGPYSRLNPTADLIFASLSYGVDQYVEHQYRVIESQLKHQAGQSDHIFSENNPVLSGEPVSTRQVTKPNEPSPVQIRPSKPVESSEIIYEIVAGDKAFRTALERLKRYPIDREIAIAKLREYRATGRISNLRPLATGDLEHNVYLQARTRGSINGGNRFIFRQLPGDTAGVVRLEIIDYGHREGIFKANQDYVIHPGKKKRNKKAKRR